MSMEEVRSIQNELTHYGVKGQKWGVRRYQNKDGTGTKLGNERRRKGLDDLAGVRKTERAKQVAATAAITTAAVLLPIESVALTAVALKSIGDAKLAKIAKETGDDPFIKKEGPIEKLKDLKRKIRPTSLDDDVKEINPHGISKRGTTDNCSYCTAAMELRARGYDVRARKKLEGVTESVYKEWFENCEIKESKIKRNQFEDRNAYCQRSFDNLCTNLESYGNGSRGYVGVVYSKMGGMGHVLNWAVENGRVDFFDGQNGKVNNAVVFAMSDPDGYTYARLDNLKLNEGVTKAVISKSSNKSNRKAS